MLRFVHRILIYDFKTGVQKYEFPSISDIEIKTGKLEFTDTAVLRFKEDVSSQNKKVSDEINRGDTIEIYLGYFDPDRDDLGYIKEYTGHIKSITPGTPTEIKCEDGMYLLKQETIEPKVFEDTNLKEIISYYYKGQTNILNADIGDWVIGKNSTLVDLFNELNSKFGMLTYFQDGILYCNAELNRTPEKTVILDINGNVVIDSDDIQAESEQNYKLVVHGVSPKKDGTKIERWAAFKDVTRTDIEFSSSEIKGVQNEVKVPERTQAQLDDLIKIRLKRLYESTTRGSITTFGFPSIKHGDKIRVKNSSEISKNGDYESVSIVKRFSVSGGYKQIVSVGLKLQ